MFVNLLYYIASDVNLLEKLALFLYIPLIYTFFSHLKAKFMKNNPLAAYHEFEFIYYIFRFEKNSFTRLSQIKI